MISSANSIVNGSAYESAKIRAATITTGGDIVIALAGHGIAKKLGAVGLPCVETPAPTNAAEVFVQNRRELDRQLAEQTCLFFDEAGKAHTYGMLPRDVEMRFVRSVAEFRKTKAESDCTFLARARGAIDLGRLLPTLPIDLAGCSVFLETHAGADSFADAVRESELGAALQARGARVLTHDGKNGRLADRINSHPLAARSFAEAIFKRPGTASQEANAKLIRAIAAAELAHTIWGSPIDWPATPATATAAIPQLVEDPARAGESVENATASARPFVEMCPRARIIHMQRKSSDTTNAHADGPRPRNPGKQLDVARPCNNNGCPCCNRNNRRRYKESMRANVSRHAGPLYCFTALTENRDSINRCLAGRRAKNDLMPAGAEIVYLPSEKTGNPVEHARYQNDRGESVVVELVPSRKGQPRRMRTGHVLRDGASYYAVPGIHTTVWYATSAPTSAKIIGEVTKIDNDEAIRRLADAIEAKGSFMLAASQDGANFNWRRKSKDDGVAAVGESRFLLSSHDWKLIADSPRGSQEWEPASVKDRELKEVTLDGLKSILEHHNVKYVEKTRLDRFSATTFITYEVNSLNKLQMIDEDLIAGQAGISEFDWFAEPEASGCENTADNFQLDFGSPGGGVCV